MFNKDYKFFSTLGDKLKLLLILFFTSTITLQVHAEKILTIGVEIGHPPFSYKTANGELAGFDYDMGKALCEQLKATCKWVEYNFDELIPAIRSSKIDMAISSISITEDRKSLVSFTDKYYKDGARLMVPKELIVSETLDELNGKKIGVLKGSTSFFYSNDELAKKGIRIISYDNQLEVFMDLITHKIDGTLADAIPLEIYFLAKPYGEDYHFVGDIYDDPKYFGEGVGIAVKKGNSTLVNELNNAIQTVRKNGTYQKIQSKYFENDIYGN